MLKLSPITAAEEAFMADFVAQTDPHPLAPFMRIWHGQVNFEVKPFSGRIQLGCIQTLFPSQGHATPALQWLQALASQHGVAIRGTVQRLGKGGLSQRDLRAWYKRHGFSVQRTGTLEYLPQK